MKPNALAQGGLFCIARAGHNPGADLIPNPCPIEAKLLARVRRILGQIDAIERALEAEVACADVLQVIASVRGAVDGLMAEVIEDHIRCHVFAPSLGSKERADGADNLIDIVRSYLK
jgi:DNA-binding FrmR family transcriptional regulator